MSANNWAECPKCKGSDEDGRVSIFREDYEIWIDDIGMFIVGYFGKCQECGFEVKFNHSHDVLES